LEHVPEKEIEKSAKYMISFKNKDVIHRSGTSKSDVDEAANRLAAILLPMAMQNEGRSFASVAFLRHKMNFCGSPAR